MAKQLNVGSRDEEARQGKRERGARGAREGKRREGCEKRCMYQQT
jgi:hypothetical protein